MGVSTTRADRISKSLLLANGATRTEHYDLLGRVQRVDEPDGSSLHYRYDVAGHLKELRSSTGGLVRYAHGENTLESSTERVTTRVAFDDNGFPASLSYQIDGHQFEVAYRRDARGVAQSVRYPGASDWLAVGAALRCGEHSYARFSAPRVEFENGTSTVEDWTTVAAEAGAKTPEPGRLQRIFHADRDGSSTLDQRYSYDEKGRVVSAGAQRFSYDEAGRLSACDETLYVFDESGRLIAAGDQRLTYDSPPHVKSVNGTTFTYDALGRRAQRCSDRGVTRYSYNLLGQLAAVLNPDGSTVQYLYDGFGRLVGRESEGGIEYFIVDFEGRRIADADRHGTVTRSYLWLGALCVGTVKGPCGGPLLQTFHRAHCGTLVAIGDSEGRLQTVPHSDPYGHDIPIIDGVPGYANLFGDSSTGLLYASCRWLDPEIGQFTTPDSWFGTRALDRLPPFMRHLFDQLPGGTGRELNSAGAYEWCARDPVNHCDPNGHNFMGLIWSTISALLWSMQVTSVAFQMELINLVFFILCTFPGFMPAWNLDFWKKIAPWNGLPPLVASSRLMVPFAFPLNSIWNAAGNAVFTMGNVIWVNGDQMSTLESTSQRDLIECQNASTYRAASTETAADVLRARSTTALGTATVNGAGTVLTGVAITTPSGAALNAVFSTNDFVSIRLQTGGNDELRQITVGANLTVTPALPVGFFNQAVDIVRLDRAAVHLQKDEVHAARLLTFIRDKSLHFAGQLPESVPTSELTVSEYMPAGVRAMTRADSPPESVLIRVASGDQSLYAASDFVRVHAGSDDSARQVARLRGSRDLILDSALPTSATAIQYQQVEVAKLAPDGAPQANQTAAADRIGVGTIADLRKRDGLAVDNTGGAPVVTARRIVKQVLLDCAVTAVPAALQGVAITVDLLTVDASRQATGTNSSATEITTDAGQAGRFSNNQPVRVRKAPSTDFFTTVSAVDGDANRITLADALPAADFANGTAVTIHLMTQTKRFAADNVAGPGTVVSLQVDRPGSPVAGDVLRVRAASAIQGGELRQLAAVPTVAARLDSALPATHTANLSVQRFTPVTSTVKNASAPAVQLRFTIQGGAMPYAQNDELFLQKAGGEQAYGKVFAAPVGQVIELQDPIEVAVGPTNIDVQRIEPTGATTTGAKLKESLIMIPSDPGEDPINRRRAVESHEMRHVWQYSVLGPFFFSLPIPWLINLGFSAFGSEATGNSADKVMRHIGVGGLDTIFALVAWGIGTGARGEATLTGELTDTARKIIQFPSDADTTALATFTEGSPCEAKKGDYATFNVIEKLEANEKRVTLRFSLEADKFATNDRVGVSVSPFEKIRATINKWFSLNLEQLWSNHIPVSWGRVLSKFLNRDSWFPGFGMYPLALMIAGGNQSRVHFEQDASYHSGDLYNDIATANPAEIFVGQFSRIFGFIAGRGAGDTATGLSDTNTLEALTVETPNVVVGGTPLQPTDLVFGSVPSSAAGRVRFRESYYLRLHGDIENAVAAFFCAGQPGTYKVHVPDQLPEGTLVNTVSFDADFDKLRNITVKALVISPPGGAANPVFETESVRVSIAGDPVAQYSLSYHGTAPAPAITIDPSNRLNLTVPVGASGTHSLDVTATYAASAAVFHGPGQLEVAPLSDAQRANICQLLEFTVQALVAPVVGPVVAGTRTTFSMPIAPASVRVTSATPAGAATNASVLNGTGRPATLTFQAPDRVAAASNVDLELVFGSGSNTKTIAVTVQVTPA